MLLKRKLEMMMLKNVSQKENLKEEEDKYKKMILKRTLFLYTRIIMIIFFFTGPASWVAH